MLHKILKDISRENRTLSMSMLGVIYFVHNRYQVQEKGVGCSRLMTNIKFSHLIRNGSNIDAHWGVPC